MNILFLTTHLNIGGITSYLHTLSKGLLKNGHKVYIVSSGGEMEASFKAIGTKIINLNIRTKSELSWKVYAALRPLVRLIKENDINVIHAQTRITQVIGFWLSVMTKAKAVSTCHGFFKPRLSRKYFQCWGKKVIAISPQVVEHLTHDLKVQEQKIILIENGIDLDDFSCDDENARLLKRKEFGFVNEPIIGIIARLSDVKGQDILISAMKIVVENMPHVKLLIIGQGKTEALLKKMVADLGLQDCIIFHPIIHQTPAILPLLDVFVMPSRMEGLGLSVMEAQAAGIPVIASRVGGIPSLIKEGETGFLVPPEDPIALANAIISVLKDLHHAKKIGLKGREAVQLTCSSDKMVIKTSEVYRSVVGEEKR